MYCLSTGVFKVWVAGHIPLFIYFFVFVNLYPARSSFRHLHCQSACLYKLCSQQYLASSRQSRPATLCGEVGHWDHLHPINHLHNQCSASQAPTHRFTFVSLLPACVASGSYQVNVMCCCCTSTVHKKSIVRCTQNGSKLMPIPSQDLSWKQQELIFSRHGGQSLSRPLGTLTFLGSTALDLYSTLPGLGQLLLHRIPYTQSPVPNG